MHYLLKLAIAVGMCFPWAMACTHENVQEQVSAAIRAGSMSIANLNLNGQGNLIAARPSEKIFGTINFSCNIEQLDSNSLNQIVIGYADLGPRKCILHELGYRCGGDRITSFFLEAPSEPGVYDIQCSLEQAHSPAEAMRNWGSGNSAKLTIGRIVVVN